MRECALESGQPNVFAPVRELLFVLAQFRRLDWRHEGPVTSDRAALDSPPAQPDRLHRYPWDPEGREEMTLPAANNEVAPQRITAKLHRHRLCKSRRQEQQTPATARQPSARHGWRPSSCRPTPTTPSTAAPVFGMSPSTCAHATRFKASPCTGCSRTQARIAREWLMMVPSESLSVGSFFVPVAANS